MNKVLTIFIFVSFMFSVDYQSEIQPIWNNNCGNCHLGNSSGDLNLSNYSNLMSNNVVVPGDHAASELYERITRDNSDAGDMPPGNSQLSLDQIDLIAQWIDEGALAEEQSDISGCMDSNAISCDDEIDSLYFPECNTCSDNDPCDNYYNPDATIDNGMCMYDVVPTAEEFSMEYFDTSINFTSGFNLDWSNFTPPIEIDQYVLQRCLDPDGDSDGDGELEYENCIMVIAPGSGYLSQTYTDEYDFPDLDAVKYTLYVHYPNNNYWGSAHGYYYYEEEPEITLGDLNFDGIINVIDIVTLVNGILGNGFSGDQALAADMNGDGIINVIDIVTLVNLILS